MRPIVRQKTLLKKKKQKRTEKVNSPEPGTHPCPEPWLSYFYQRVSETTEYCASVQ